MASESKRGADSRFKDLIEPIRDLAKNWNIDVANELEDYLDELGNIKISFDGGRTNLNFAEAALVIQGSVCVYSKKVEYLSNLVYQVLDHLAQGKTEKALALRRNETELDAAAQDDVFLELDDVLDKGADIDLPRTRSGVVRGEVSARYHVGAGSGFGVGAGRVGGGRRHTAPTPVTVTPSGALVEADGRPLTGASLSIGSKPGGGSFRLAACSVYSESGALMFDASQKLGSAEGDEQGEGESKGFESPIGHSGSIVGPILADLPDAFDGDDGDDGDDGPAFDWEAPATPERADVSVAEPRPVTRAVAPKRVDPWAQLDPHMPAPETGALSHKLLRKGRTYSVPVDPTTIAKFGKPKTATHSKDSFSRHTWGPVTASQTLYFPQFSTLMKDERKRRAKERATLAAEAAYNVLDDMSEDEATAIWEGDDAGDDGADDWDEPGANWEANFEDARSIDHDSTMSMSQASTTYEDVCRRHIEEFMRGAEDHSRTSRLAQRVDDWQTKLAPILEEQDSRPSFDIQSYGRRIIRCIDPEISAPSLDAPKHPVQSEPVDFRSLAAGKEKYEVCRMFLASLQLANHGNVELCHDIPSESTEHPLKLRFITATDAVDLEATAADVQPQAYEATGLSDDEDADEEDSGVTARLPRRKAKTLHPESADEQVSSTSSRRVGRILAARDENIASPTPKRVSKRNRRTPVRGRRIPQPATHSPEPIPSY